MGVEQVWYCHNCAHEWPAYLGIGIVGCEDCGCMSVTLKNVEVKPKEEEPKRINFKEFL